MRPLRIGVIGTGRIVRRWLRDVPAEVSVVAIASQDADRARDAAARLGIPEWEAPYGALIARPDIEAVYIATPHDGHLPCALAAMEAGKHVLCEKPIAVNTAQFDQMTAYARKQGVLLMEAMWTRCFPAMRRLGELIAEGAIGKVRYVQASFAGKNAYDPSSRLYDPAKAGGSLLDVGCYGVHFVNLCYGEAVPSVTGQLVLDGGVDVQAALSLAYPGGGLASVFSSVAVSAPSTAWAFGTEGSIEVPDFWHPSRLFLRKPGTEEQVFSFPYTPEGFAFETLHFADCVRKGLKEAPWVPHRATRGALSVMDAVRAQSGLVYPLEGEDTLGQAGRV